MDLRGFGKKDKRTWFYTSKAESGDFIALFTGVFYFNGCSIFKTKCISKLLVSILKALAIECFYLFLSRHAQKRDIYIMYNTNQLK